MRIENGELGLDVETSRQFSLRGIHNKRSGRYYEIAEAAPAAILLSAARERIPISSWRMNLTSPARDTDHLHERGYLAGFHTLDVADEDWYEVEFPFGTSFRYQVRGTPNRYEGYGWFRRCVDLPADGAGETIGFVIGGYDQHDWNEYWIYLNGRLIGHRLANSFWRQPAVIELSPGDPGYSELRFGQPNLLALQTCTLHRARPDMRDDDDERYVFSGSLADQFVTIGPPYDRVSEYELVDWSSEGQGAEAGIRAQLLSRRHDLKLSVHYRLRDGEPYFHKWVELENTGADPLLVLDVVALEFSTHGQTSTGGRGHPVYLDEQLFAGVEHPAGINQGFGAAMRLWHCPGKRLEPGQSMSSLPVVLGVATVGQARQAFRDYLMDHGHREPKPFAIWSTEGMHDYPFAPTWEEQVIPEEKMLQALDWMETTQEKHGKLFDYFVLDVGWQDHTSDLTRFNQQFWPQGPERVVQRVQELGMEFGLWFSATMASWSCGGNPEVQDCFVPRPGNEAPEEPFVPEAGPAGYTFPIYDMLCPASEPYRGILREAILHHIRENRMRLFKVDTSHYVCHSECHDHLPGKYSTEAMMDVVIQIVADAREACPDLFIMWYWGHSSPFWALFGSAVFECGVSMEASNTSSHPSLFYRDSVTTYIDEGTRFFDEVPPNVKDSLGVWIGDNQWANFMGKEDWRNAWIADLGRGSLMAQLWGNVFLFDEDETRFLAATLAWFRENAELLSGPVPALGDPWLGEPYGYLHTGPDRAFLFAHNPTFQHRLVAHRLGDGNGSGRDGPWQVSRLYPDKAAFHKADGYLDGDSLNWWLRPFEVALLQLDRTSTEPGALHPLDPSLPPAHPSRALSWSLTEGEIRGGKRTFSGSVDLPTIEVESTIGLVLRCWRDGAFWRSTSIHELIAFDLSVDGQPAAFTTVPARRTWSTNNWLLAKLNAPADWSGKRIQVKLAAAVASEVQLEREAWLVPNWWTEPKYESP